MNVGARVARGAGWMLLMRVVDRSIALASTMILARVLTPESFGLIALATMVIGLVEVMGSFGFDTVLIQTRTQSRPMFDTAWTFGVLYGFAAALLIAAIATPIAQFFVEPRLGVILLVLAVTPALAALENIGTVKFRMELDFRREFLLLAGKRLPGIAVTVPLAVVTRSYWALVAGIVVGRIWGLGMSYFMCPYRPRFSLAARSSLAAKAGWLLAYNVLAFTGHRVADMVLGRIGGAQAVGLFSVAQELAFLPATEFLAPVHRAIFPGYARIAADPQQMGAAFLQVTSVLVLVTVPACIGIALSAPLLVAVLLGPQWTAAVPLVAMLAIGGIAGSVSANATYGLLALGEMRPVALQSALRAAMMTVLMIPLTMRYGLEGAAWANVITAFVACAFMLTLVASRFGVTVRSVAGILWRPVLAALGMWACLRPWVASLGAPDALPAAAARLALVITAGALLYTGAVFALWRLAGAPAGAERQVLQRVRG